MADETKKPTPSDFAALPLSHYRQFITAGRLDSERLIKEMGFNEAQVEQLTERLIETGAMTAPVETEAKKPKGKKSKDE